MGCEQVVLIVTCSPLTCSFLDGPELISLIFLYKVLLSFFIATASASLHFSVIHSSLLALTLSGISQVRGLYWIQNSWLSCFLDFKPFLASLNLRTSSDIHGFLLLLLCCRMFDTADRIDLLNATKVMLISSRVLSNAGQFFLNILLISLGYFWVIETFNVEMLLSGFLSCRFEF